jgi:uncharacterized iron-regulated membrane protein
MRKMLSLVLTLLLVFGSGYWYGSYTEKETQQAESGRLKAQAQAKEQALTTAVTTTADALRKVNEKAKNAAQQRDAAIDSGALRLRLQTTCPVPTAEDTPTPAGDSGGKASAELDRETAKALVAITDEGNRAIEKLNACIGTYEKMRHSK